jgi:peptidyl-prolyl cis-trans isomerase SurA
VWGPAQTDSVALEKYFNQHRGDYMWKQSADAVIFYATDAASAQTFLKELRKNPKNWNSLTSQFAEKIAADSSRFELTQIPNPSKAVLKPGTITNLLTNKSDNTVSFAYIIRSYNNTAPRSFAEARGLVINDYQVELEKNWLNELRKKYPVRINQAVLDDLVKNRKY